MNMETTLTTEIDSQLKLLQQLTRNTENLKEKCSRLEREKNEAITNYEAMKDKLERLINKRCTNCSILTNELNKERKEKAKLKREERAKLLKTIAKTLENIDDGNSNHVNQLLTELNCGRLNESPEEKSINLIDDTESSVEEVETKILVNDTVIVDCYRATNVPMKHPIIIPETEAVEFSTKNIGQKKIFEDIPLPKFKNWTYNHTKENYILPDDKEVEQASKKLRLSPVLSSQTPPRDKTQLNHSAHSPSVLSEIIEAAGGSTSFSCQNDKGTAWKMKPSLSADVVCTSAAGGKKLKQMTLSVTRPEKKHDISLSENFRGGVAKFSDEEDIILPSPEQNTRKLFVKKATISGTLDDPDMTVFNPAVTSTCLPVPGETSFDRLPDVEKSPEYKYRRDAVRKKCDRMKLPGQDCDQCMKYYEAAGLNDTLELRRRLDKCSRHRDKYQLRANTPPGFWDPVLPTTPEDS